MNQHNMRFLIIFVAVTMVLGACSQDTELNPSQEPTVPPDMVEHYINYLETAKYDWHAAINDFCHFELQDRKAMAEISKTYIQDYEILTWERISDRLWVVNTTIVDAAHPEGVIATNFVGIIDDQYYVMTGVDQVPNSLKENADIESYRPTGDNIVDPEDVLGPIG